MTIGQDGNWPNGSLHSLDTLQTQTNLAKLCKFLCLGSKPLVIIRLLTKVLSQMDSGCGTVGRVVASYTRDLQFESQHWQKFICKLYNLEKTKIRKKRTA